MQSKDRFVYEAPSGCCSVKLKKVEYCVRIF